MMDLSQFSDRDLQALKTGNLELMSDEGLRALSGKPASAPVDDPGFGKTLLIGAGRTFDRLGKGVEQMYYGARSALSGPDATSLVTGGKNQWDVKGEQLRQAAESDDAAYKPLKDARPWATGIGEALPTLIAPGTGATSLLGNAARMAVTAAVPAALEYGTPEERLQRAKWAAVSGAAVPFVGAGLGAAKSAVEPFYKQGQDLILSRLLNRVAGSDAANVAARLKSAAPVLPGSMPTAAQVAESGGISALERAAAAANPTPYTERFLEQAAARKAALQSIAGKPGELEAAQAMRKQVADATYGLARDAGPDARVFTPEAQANIAAMQARVPDAAQQTARDIAKIYGAPMDNSTVVNGLHWTKQALDGLIGSETNATMKGALQHLRGQYADGLEQISPLYGAANGIYADMSKPINQMSIGSLLYDKLIPALGREGAPGAPTALGRETAAAYANALDEAGQLAKKATGRSNADIADILTPKQMDLANGVRADLARKANAQDLGRGVGSDTFQKLSMGNLSQRSGMPGLVGGLLDLPGLSHLGGWAYGKADEKMQGLLADALLNPQATAGLLGKASPKLLPNNPAARKALEQLAIRSGLLAPALENYSAAEAP